MRHWREGNPGNKVVGKWNELCSSVGWKGEFVSDELDIYLRMFPSNIWKMCPGFSLQLIVKHRRKGINGGRSC